MTITKKNWQFFVLLSVFSVLIWIKYTLPRFTSVNLSVDKAQSLAIAKDFLRRNGAVPEDYRTATIFAYAGTSDRFLQKAIGSKGERAFLKDHKFSLFSWKTRFFKENEQEEYAVSVDPSDGQVLAYNHVIKENASRPEVGETAARERLMDFLRGHFKIDFEQYELQANHAAELDNRTDFSFSWRRKDVFLRWNKESDSGGGKLLAGGRISGDEILYFYNNRLSIPDEFNRTLNRQMTVGRNIASIFRVLYYALITGAIFYVIVKRPSLVLQRVKSFGLFLTLTLFLFYLFSYFNSFESILYKYPTTSSLAQYLWRDFTNNLLNMFIVAIRILLPFLAGECLHYENFPKHPQSSFLYFLRSTFCSRKVFSGILLGYLVAITLVGLQSLAFLIGQEHLGVWVEQQWMTSYSGLSLPILGALIFGFSASVVEEIIFRLFAINLGKKFLKNTFIAVFLAAVVWGYGHSGYMVFPMWFRGLEVTLLGLFLGWIFLRFGIIPVIVAHFLFDVFWSCSDYLLGRATPELFFGAIGVLLLPLITGFIAFLINKREELRPLSWHLNTHQRYNLSILKEYLTHHPDLLQRPPQQLALEISSHGWDIAVVEIALKEIQSPSSS